MCVRWSLRELIRGAYNYLLAAESLVAKNSGIGRVAWRMVRGLDETTGEQENQLPGISLSDPRGFHPGCTWSKPRRASRTEYISRVHAVWELRRTDGLGASFASCAEG